MLFVAVFTPDVSAQRGGSWQPAFARPQGAFLINEIRFRPERFLVEHKGEIVSVAGKFQRSGFSHDGDLIGAAIVWGTRISGVMCLTDNKDVQLKITDLVMGEEVIASGIVTRYDGYWLYLEECSIKNGVTLFHDRDPDLILGTWCAVLEGSVSRKYNFTRNDQGQYLLSTQEDIGSDQWSYAKPARVERLTARRLNTAIIGRKRDYAFNNFTVISPNQLSRSDGFRFHRCQ